MHTTRALLWVLLAVGGLLVASPARASSPPADGRPSTSATASTGEASDPDHVPGEEAILMRLMAPCCWQQTLDVHDSPVSTQLRGEIRARMRAGESPDTIQQAMVSRYGERIVALRRDDPLDDVSVALAAVALAAAAGLVWAASRWVRASPDLPDEGNKPAGRDAYDDRLDAALDELDD